MNSTDHDYLVGAENKQDYLEREQDVLTMRRNEIAVAMVASNRLFQAIDFDNSMDKHTLLYRGLQSTIDNMERYYGNLPFSDAMTHQLTGFNEGEQDHYIIDKDLDEEFGDKVMTDSESGMFVTMVQADAVDEVVAYLAGRYRLLTFDVRDNRDDRTFTPTVKALSNWPNAEDYVKANKLGHLVTALIKSF